MVSHIYSAHTILMKKIILTAIFAFGVTGAWAQTAPPPRRHMFSAAVGLAEPVSRVDFKSIGGGSADNGDLGVQLGAQYLYFPGKRLGGGFEASYVSRSGTLSTRLYPAADARVAGDSWLMLGVLRYSLRDHGWARPFVLVGAGGAWNKTTIDVQPSEWADTGTREVRRLIDDSAWAPAASARLGVDVEVDALSPGFFSFEVGWTGIASSGYSPTPRGTNAGLGGGVKAALQLVSFSARHCWRF